MPHQSPHVSSSPLSDAFRDKSIVPVGVVGLLLRRSSAAVTLEPMALSSAVFADPAPPFPLLGSKISSGVALIFGSRG